jgi:hypothetical protein
VRRPLVAASNGPRPLVIFEQITGEVAGVLRDVGCGYADGAGALYLPEERGATGDPALVLPPPPPERIAASVRWAISEQMADREGHFATLDLYCGGRDRLAERDLGRLPRAPDALLDNPIGLLGWLATLSVTRRVHPQLLTYLACSDPDEILPFLPWHAKGPDVALDELDLLVRGASVVSAVELLAERDWRTGGDVLVLPGGSTAVLGGS